MNRSKRPVPPQGDNPDQWPELSELGNGSAQAGQHIPHQPPQMDPQPAGVRQPGESGQYAATAPATGQPGSQPATQTAAQHPGQPPAPAPAPNQAYHMPQAPLAPAIGPPGQVGAPREYTHPPQHTQPPVHTQPPQHTQPPVHTQPPQQHTPPPPQSEPAQFTAPPTSPPPEYTHPPEQQPAATGDYAPQFNRYAPPPGVPLQAPQYGTELAFGVPGEPGQLQSGQPSVSQQPAFQGEPGAAGHEQLDAGQDPSGYELGQYNPVVPEAAAGMAAGAAVADPYQGEPYQQAAAGADQPVYAQQFQQDQPFQPEWTGSDPQTGQFGDGTEFAASGDTEAFDEGYDDGDAGYDEPRRGGRGLLIASALVGAIALGGGLAYGYKHFVSAAKNPTGTRVIAADSRPVKVRPKNPGGRSFRNQDKKVFSSRLGSGSSRVASRTIANGNVRKVPTMVIRPNGSVAAPGAPAATPKQRLAVPGIYVPGVTVEPPRVGRSSATAAPIRRVPALAKPAVVLPKARPLLKPRIKNAANVAGTTRVIAPAKMVKKLAARAPVKKPAKKVAKAAARTPVVASAGGGGYVAWISSSKDRLRSLASFANLQQKFPAVLAGKQPEIQQKEVPNRGTWYRLRIGPPASKGATAALCKSLIAAKGVKQCFVRRY